MSTENKGNMNADASGSAPLEVDGPMAKWRKPQSVEFIQKALKDYSFPNWQSGNEDSIYYNMNFTEIFKCSYVAPAEEPSELERALDPSLMDLTFTAHDGTTTPPLRGTTWSANGRFRR